METHDEPSESLESLRRRLARTLKKPHKLDKDWDQYWEEIERRAEHYAPLAEALAWALPYADEHAERGSQCCGAAEYSEAEGICAQCHEHTGFDNPDLEHAQAALKAAEEATS